MAKTKIGADVSLDGAKQFKKDIDNINSSIKLSTAELELNSVKYSQNAKSMEALSSKGDLLQKMYANQQNAVERHAQNLTELTAKYGANSTQVTKAQASYTKVQTELEKTTQAIKKNDEELEKSKTSTETLGTAQENLGRKATGLSGIIQGLADKLGITLPAPLQGLLDKFGGAGTASGDLTGKLGEMGQAAGIDLPPQLSGLTSSLAGVSGGALVAVGAAVAVVKALTDMAIAGAKAADTIMTNASIMGVTTERYQELAYMADLVDTSTETLGNSMTKLTRTMGEAQSGAEKPIESFRRLGIAWKDDVTGALRDDEQVFYEIIDALGKVKNETEREALAMSLLGRSAKDLNPLIEAGSARMRELSQEAHNVGAVMSTETLAVFGKMADELDRNKTITEGLKNTLGSSLAPLFTSIMQTLNTVLGTLSAKLNDSQAIGYLQIVGGIIGSILNLLGTFAVPVITLIFDYLEKIYGVVNIIIAPIVFAVSSLANLLGLLTGAKSFDEFSRDSVAAFDKMTASIDKSTAAILGQNEKLKESGKETGESIGASLSEGYSQGTAVAEKEAMTMKEANEAIKKAREENREDAKRHYVLIENMSGGLEKAHKKDYELYEKYSEYINTHYASLSEKEKIAIAKKLELQNAQYAQNSQNLSSRGQKSGEEYITGVTIGLSNKEKEAYQKTEQIGENIDKSFRASLKIKSPSQVGIKSTEYYGDGLVLGLVNRMKAVKQKMLDYGSIISNTSYSPPNMAIAGISENINLMSYKAMDIATRSTRQSQNEESPTQGGSIYNITIEVNPDQISRFEDIIALADSARIDRRSGKRRR